jgi:hypothetical protein
MLSVGKRFEIRKPVSMKLNNITMKMMCPPIWEDVQEVM